MHVSFFFEVKAVRVSQCVSEHKNDFSPEYNFNNGGPEKNAIKCIHHYS